MLAGIAAVVAAAARVDLRPAQLALLGVGVGLDSAASVTRTAPEVPARSTPAEILTGSPLPGAPTIGSLLGSWRPDALWLVLAAALLVGYGAAVHRSALRWPPARTLAWVAGLVLLVWLTCGGPAVYQQVLVAAHLGQHVALLLVVPVLLAGGAPRRLLARALPSAAPPRPRGLLANPVTALVVVLAIPLLLVGTGLLRWSVDDPVGTETSVVACLLAGALLVHSIGRARDRRTAIAVVAVLLVAETAAAAVLGSSSSLLAADWFGAMGWGTDALTAQQGAAALVWAVAAVPSLILLVVALRSPARRAAPLARPEGVTA